MARIKEGTKRIYVGNNKDAKICEKSETKTILVKFLDSLEVAEPVSYKNLLVFPIFKRKIKKVEKLKTLPEAIKEGIVEIKETGTVSQLKIINKSTDTKILIIEGTTVKGGAQNRVINTTIILDEKATTQVPVSCVEQNRWHGFDKPFAKDVNDIDYVVPSVYKSLHGTVSSTLCQSSGRSYASNQSVVWGSASNYLLSAGSMSGTGDVHKVYEDKKEDVDKILKQILDVLPKGSERVGIISIIGEKAIYVDISVDQDIASVQIPLILKSHVLESLTEKSDASSEERKVQEIVNMLNDLVSKAKLNVYDSVNKLGKNVRFNMDDISGSALIFKGELIHMSILGKL